MKPWMAASMMLCAAIGCSSARSTMIHRGELDMRWEKERLLHGVPITVQVPTHIRVDVYEHHFLGRVNMKPGGGDVGQVSWLDETAVDVPLKSVHTELIRTAKIFTVDPQRPAAGTMRSTMKFGGVNGQYLDDVGYRVEDKTIEAITGVIQQVAKKGLIGVPTTDGVRGTGADQYLHRVDGIVASAFFSLDAPDVELQVAHFLEIHLNGCHPCPAVPLGTEVPSRLPPLLEPCAGRCGGEGPAAPGVAGPEPPWLSGVARLPSRQTRSQSTVR